MKEMTTVTQKPALESAFSELFGLFSKRTMKFLKHYGNLEKPIVVCKQNTIRIENWPSKSIKDGCEAIDAICYRIKSLYAYGDTSGRKGSQKIKAQNQELQNNKFRMCISYTCSLIRESENSPRALVIKPIISRTEHGSPQIIVGTIIPSELSQEQLDELGKINSIDIKELSESTKPTTLIREMTPDEEDLYFHRFMEQCRKDIQIHIDKVYEETMAARESGLKILPDYGMLTS